MQAAKIPKGQAILLAVGDYYEKDGLLRVRGKKAFGTTSFSTLGTIFDMWDMRGGIVEPLPPKHIDNLQSWIDRKQKSMEKIEREGKRDIYPLSPTFNPGDIRQPVEEIRDWRVALVSGIPGFGPKIAKSVWEYAQENISDALSLYSILCLITDQDEKGRRLHNIPLIGKKTHEQFRGMFGIKDGENLSKLASKLVHRLAFAQGWRSFGDELLELVNKKGKSPSEAHKKLMKKLENITMLHEEHVAF